MSSTRVDHTNTVCCRCGCTDTSGSWNRYKDNKGRWDGKSYVCTKCKRHGNQNKDDIDNKRKEYFKNKFKTENRVCVVCGSSDNVICRYKEKGVWDRKSFLCNSCYKSSQKYVPGTIANFMMSESKCRKGEFDINRGRCRGCIGVQIVGNTFGVEDLNIKMDRFNYYIDLSKISKYGYGYSEVKTATFNVTNGVWKFNTEKEQEYDTLFLVCMDCNELWENVERIYAIPWEYAVKVSGISITKNPSRIGLYEKFRIDEKPFNDNYHDIGMKCPVLMKKK